MLDIRVVSFPGEQFRIGYRSQLFVPVEARVLQSRILPLMFHQCTVAHLERQLAGDLSQTGLAHFDADFLGTLGFQLVYFECWISLYVWSRYSLLETRT